jgi:hypothetical protein
MSKRTGDGWELRFDSAKPVGPVGSWPLDELVMHSARRVHLENMGSSWCLIVEAKDGTTINLTLHGTKKEAKGFVFELQAPPVGGPSGQCVTCGSDDIEPVVWTYGPPGGLPTLFRRLDLCDVCRLEALRVLESEERVPRVLHAKVVAAAIRTGDGTVYSVPAPGRHHNVIALMAEARVRADGPSCTQGFLTDTGRFVDRKAAERLARASGQVSSLIGSVLTSEDLW